MTKGKEKCYFLGFFFIFFKEDTNEQFYSLHYDYTLYFLTELHNVHSVTTEAIIFIVPETSESTVL